MEILDKKVQDISETNNDWVKVKLGDVSTIYNGRAYKQKELLDSGKYKVLRVGNFFTSNKWYYSNLELEDNIYVFEDDLMYAWSASFGPRFWQGEKTIFHYHIWKIETANKLNKQFLFYYLQFSDFKIQRTIQGGTMAHITKGDMEKRIVHLPNMNEQKSIVHILSTWDQAIEKTQKLLNQFQLRKKGLMQELFTGKKRLPGFDGEWKKYEIGEIASQFTDKNKNNSITEVLSCTKYDGLVKSLEYFGRKVFGDDLTKYKVVPRNHFAYATNHIEEGSIGYQNLLDAGLVSPMYTVFKTNIKVDDFYFYRLLKTDRMLYQYQSNMSGSIARRGGLRWNVFKEIIVALPPIEEQKAITSFLDEADKEIELQKARLNLLTLQKKGLMQELLTGKKRVKIDE